MRGEESCDREKGVRTGMTSAVEGIYLWGEGGEGEDEVLMWLSVNRKFRGCENGGGKGPNGSFLGETFCLLFFFFSFGSVDEMS